MVIVIMIFYPLINSTCLVLLIITISSSRPQAPSQSSSPPRLTPAGKVDDSPLNLSKVFFLCPSLSPYFLSSVSVTII